MCVCLFVCLFVCTQNNIFARWQHFIVAISVLRSYNTHTHTHTRKCVCLSVCLFVCLSKNSNKPLVVWTKATPRSTPE